MIGTTDTSGYRDQSLDLDELNREDLSDVITQISPTETPLYSILGTKTAQATFHEWGRDELKERRTQSDAHQEGADYKYRASKERTRDGNYTQIFTNPFAISDTQRKVLKAGITDEVTYQMAQAMREHKLDVEHAMFNNTSGGDDGTAGAGISNDSGVRVMKPIGDFIGGAAGTDALHRLDLSEAVLTEVMINDALQQCWQEGGNPSILMCSGTVKRRITGFVTANINARTIEMTQNPDRRSINTISIYEGDFGEVRIVPNRNIDIETTGTASSSAYLLEPDHWSYAYLQPVRTEDVARTGDATKKVVYQEGTVVGRAPRSGYWFQNVKNALS